MVKGTRRMRIERMGTDYYIDCSIKISAFIRSIRMLHRFSRILMRRTSGRNVLERTPNFLAFFLCSDPLIKAVVIALFGQDRLALWREDQVAIVEV